MTSRKNSDLPLMMMIVLVYATVCMETDIYVPSFPDMRLFFGVSDAQIQYVLSANFAGICLGSLFFGPLSDSMGRKKSMLIGLGLFAVSSWGCLIFTHFEFFLLARFIQGLGAAAPMVISFAIILDKFDAARSAQLCGALNIFITGAMAGAPLLGSILNITFGWQSNFLLIAVLATTSLFGGFFLIPESLPKESRLPLSTGRIVKDYGRILSSFPYMAGTIICFLLFSSLIMFTANLSLIFIEYLGVSQIHYSFYQAATTSMFAICSFLSIGLIRRLGTEKTKSFGLIAATIGAAALLGVALAFPNPVLICVAMAIFIAGVTFAGPIFAVNAANAIPDLKGSAAGMNNALRHIIVAGVVVAGCSLFNGSILPVALIIMISTTLVLILYVALKKRDPQVMESTNTDTIDYRKAG